MALNTIKMNIYFYLISLEMFVRFDYFISLKSVNFQLRFKLNK